MVGSWGGHWDLETQLKHLVTKLRDQYLWRWVAVSGICASEALPPHDRCSPQVSYKDRPGLSFPWHPPCSRRAQGTLGHPKSTAPAQEEHLASRSAVHRSRARAGQAWQGGTPGLLTIKPAVCSETKHSPGTLLLFRLLRPPRALRDMAQFKRMETHPECFSCCQRASRLPVVWCLREILTLR